MFKSVKLLMEVCVYVQIFMLGVGKIASTIELQALIVLLNNFRTNTWLIGIGFVADFMLLIKYCCMS